MANGFMTSIMGQTVAYPSTTSMITSLQQNLYHQQHHNHPHPHLQQQQQQQQQQYQTHQQHLVTPQLHSLATTNASSLLSNPTTLALEDEHRNIVVSPQPQHSINNFNNTNSRITSSTKQPLQVTPRTTLSGGKVESVINNTGNLHDNNIVNYGDINSFHKHTTTNNNINDNGLRTGSAAIGGQLSCNTSSSNNVCNDDASIGSAVVIARETRGGGSSNGCNFSSIANSC